MQLDPPSPAAAGKPKDRERGTSQAGLRLYNERLVLSLVRHHGALPRADIARLTGLSPPTVSAIVRVLKADGLVREEKPQRGRIGQPSVPVALHPQGAYAFGVKVGRRSADIVLVNFVGEVQHRLHKAYTYPEPEPLVAFVKNGVEELADRLPASQRARISGIGVAAPFELWSWEEELGAPPGAMEPWRHFDLQAAIGRVCDWPVYHCNDATAACAAELLASGASHRSEFLHIFIAWFIGGGVVIDNNLFPGRNGYSGAIGPLLVPGLDAEGRPVGRPLHESASVYVLARMLEEAGRDPRPIWETPEDWSALEPVLQQWIDLATTSLAHAIFSAMAVVEFQEVVIDGVMPREVRSRIVSGTRERLRALGSKGLAPFVIREGNIGARAPATGAACLPYLAKFMRDRELLFRDHDDAEPAEGRPFHAARPSAF